MTTTTTTIATTTTTTTTTATTITVTKPTANAVTAAKCPKCGTSPTGKRSCCARGGAWRGKCGDDGENMEYTWTEGLDACQCKSSMDIIITHTFCLVIGSLFYLFYCDFSLPNSICTTSIADIVTTTTTTATTTTTTTATTITVTKPTKAVTAAKCPKCGSSRTDKRSCCAPGGAWRGKCGDDGENMEHTWTEGLDACQCKSSIDVNKCSLFLSDDWIVVSLAVIFRSPTLFAQPQ